MERGSINILTACEEIRNIEMKEDGVAVDQDEEKCPKNAPVSNIRLETIVIGILRQIEPLCYQSSSYISD
jgi:hypothetical protein